LAHARTNGEDAPLAVIQNRRRFSKMGGPVSLATSAYTAGGSTWTTSLQPGKLLIFIKPTLTICQFRARRSKMPTTSLLQST